MALGALIAPPAIAGNTDAANSAKIVGRDHIEVAARVVVTADPELVPAFDPDIQDYVVRCAATGAVTLKLNAPARATLSVGGAKLPPGTVTWTAPLRPGQRVTWSIRRSGLESIYSARCLPADFPTFTAEVAGRTQAEWFITAPSLYSPAPYVIVFDEQGTPVWWMRDPDGLPIDAKLMGGTTLAWTTIGAGTYTFRRLDGRTCLVLGGTLDNHDIQRTPSGSYLAIRYTSRNCPAVPADCLDETPWGGPAVNNPIDAQIIELDTANREIWSWSTQGHVDPSESSSWFPFLVGGDAVHMNSVQPDGRDGLLFTARHLDALYHLTKSTGTIDWKLGGTPTVNSLRVVGDIGPGPLFSGLHDGRILPDGTVTVHDNRSLTGLPPRALRFRIDTRDHTAVLVEKVIDSRISGSGCCGSARRLSGGNWVAAWGLNSMVTELTPAGAPVLTLTFDPGTFTYRAVPVERGVLDRQALVKGMDTMSRYAGLIGLVEPRPIECQLKPGWWFHNERDR